MNYPKPLERKQTHAQQQEHDKEQSSAKLPSSHGDSPQEITPKEVTPGDVAWSDVTVRETASEDLETRQDALLDEAVEQTFPASDPVAELPAHSGQLHLVWEDEEEELLDEAIEMTFPASDPIAIAEPSRDDWRAKSAHPKP